MKGYRNYFGKKLIWFFITLVVAFVLNFILPRLMPGDPVAAIVARMAQGMSNTAGVQAIYEQYTELFGTNLPIHEQFFLYVKNVFRGDFGFSFSQYPRTVADVLRSSLPWTIALQLPAILVGWLIGNMLGALAAYRKGAFDKVFLPASLFASSIPAFGMAVILLVIFAVNLQWFPTSGGYGFDLIPNLSWSFIWSVIVHYQLPFWSLVLITIGGQAIGMRSMAIYELNADYVKYSRFMGIKDDKIVRYVFRNAMLPQITGLALSLGTMIGGALVAEVIFSYPGLGSTILTAVLGQDYPLISATTLMITIMVLLTTFLIEMVYGIIDPRIKAAQAD
ncbi:Binding-protein-dependent transport systems inner membrane component [Candidatus Promineifilum breve]|uniref:Binding-protein-dependent transport systems inner membrane component n=1 Tax=Candidatus Promineifilum breve TaxID=1806508 RepID=A0A160T2N8_9CHLR|nr:ABC transporter permease [Candidatus Promineifilum breve]CUS03519.2 Binding-protein-dependent transport systems inner membrane component [Candidatus Promineifilum breve]